MCASGLLSFLRQKNLWHVLCSDCHFTLVYHLVSSFREDERSIKGEDNDTNATNNIVKKDAVSSAEETEQPNSEEDIVGDEEFDQCNSMTMDSQKGKMAELEDTARLLQAKFEVENRKSMERIEKVKEEFKASQEKETTMTQECEEIETKVHSLREDMRCLEKKTMERETLEREQKKKIAKEKRKVTRKLKKIKAKESAATETVSTSKEDEITEDVYLKEPLFSDQPLVHSGDKTTSIQTKQMFVGAASLKEEMSVEINAIVARDDELCSCKDGISELCHRKMDAAEEEDDLQTEDNKISKAQEERVESVGEDSQVQNGVIDKDTKKNDHDSSAQDSITSVNDECFEDSTLSLSHQDMSDIRNDALAVAREEEADDNPAESWNALDSLTLPWCRPEKYCFSMSGCLLTRKFDDRVLLQNGLKINGNVTAVVNISEQILQKELLNVFKAGPAVQNTRALAVSYIKQPLEIEIKDDVSSEQENHQGKEHYYMKEERSEILNGEKALCTARESLQVSLEVAGEQKDNFASEMVELANKENAKLKNQIAAMKEEAKTSEIEKQRLQTELETVRLELKRLTFSELEARRESASKMVIYAEEVRKDKYSRRKEKKRKRKNEMRKLRKEQGDTEEELVSTKRRLSQKKHELEETKRTLTFLTDTAEALQQRVLEMDYLFENSSTFNSDISSIADDDCSLSDSVWSLDIYSLEEAGNREQEKFTYEELSFKNKEQGESKGLSTEELKSGSDELTCGSQTDEDTMATLLTTTAEEGSEAVETQLVHLYQILNDSLQELQEFKTAHGQKQDYWKTKKRQRVSDVAAAWLNNELCVRDNQMEMLTHESAQIMKNLNASIKHLEGELADTQMLLKEKTEALEDSETKLQSQTSLLASAETKHGDIMKQLQEDLERTKTLLKEKEDALEHTEAKMKQQTSLLASEEAKYEDIFKQLKEDLENTRTSLKETKDELEQTKGKLQSQESVFASTEGKYEEIIKQLQEELENMYTLLKERTQTRDKTEAKLQWRTSLFESTESKYEDIIKQLQGELESMHTLAKERTTALEQTQARLEMCLNNEKSQVVQKMKFGAVELTQDELELILAELARTKSEKTKLLREVANVTACLKLEKRMAQRDRDALWELFNAALKELEAKMKVIEEFKMGLKESEIPALCLDPEKREMQKCDSNYEQIKQESKPMIGSIKQDNCEMKRENQRLDLELLQKIDEMTYDVEEDTPSRPLTVRGVFTHLNVTHSIDENYACDVLPGHSKFSPSIPFHIAP